MSIRAAIHHLTHYKYDRPVSLSPQIIRLRPAPHSRTRVISHSLKVSPAGHFVNHQQDPYGNWLARYVFPELVTEFKIEVDVVADMTVYNPFDFFVEESAERWPFDYGEDLRAGPRHLPHARARRPAPAGVPRPARPVADPDGRFRRRPQPAPVAQPIKYLIRMEPGVQTPGGDPRAGLRVVPRFELASGPDPAPSRLRRALRLRLSDPAQARPDRARRAAGHRPRLHRPARLGRGLSAGRGLDRPRSDLGPARRRKPHPARRDAALPQRRADLRRLYRLRQRRRSTSTCGSTRVSEHPRITKPFSEEAWGALDRLGDEVDENPRRPKTCA